MIIHLHTSRFASRHKAAWVSALGGLVVLGAASVAMQGSPLRSTAVRPLHADKTAFAPADGAAALPAESGRPVARAARGSAAQARAPQGATDEQAPVPPFRYVGHWKEHGATSVVLGDRGRTLVVRVPGAVDERYQVVSVDEHRLVIKYLPLGIVQTLTLSPGAPWMVRSAAHSTPTLQAISPPISAPVPQDAGPSTSVRRKAADVESSMEAPGLPVVGNAPPPSGRDPEPDN
jgi:hypothetical protein